ncbi:hypothetical protein AKJ16_DCAP12427 [Drosera capensis]
MPILLTCCVILGFTIVVVAFFFVHLFSDPSSYHWLFCNQRLESYISCWNFGCFSSLTNGFIFPVAGLLSHGRFTLLCCFHRMLVQVRMPGSHHFFELAEGVCENLGFRSSYQPDYYLPVGMTCWKFRAHVLTLLYCYDICSDAGWWRSNFSHASFLSRFLFLFTVLFFCWMLMALSVSGCIRPQFL